MSRIMHVTQCFGGVETYIRSFNDYGALNGFEDKLLVVPRESSLSQTWKVSGGRTALVKMVRPISPIADALAVIRLTRLIVREKPDVLHLHSSKAGAIGRIAALFARLGGFRTKVIYTPHAFYYLAAHGIRRKILLGIERLLASITDILISTSPSEAHRATEEVRYPLERVFNVSNGVMPGHNVCRTTSNDQLKIIFVGRVCPQKNIELLVETIAQFKNDDSVKFTLVGVGHYAEDRAILDNLLTRNSIPESLVTVIPWVTHETVMELFTNSDVCLVTSRYESFGYVAAEAGSVGLPVIVTDVDGLRDIVVDGVTGFVAKDSSAHTMAQLLRRLRSSDLRITLGNAARKRIEDEFNIRKNAALLAQYYEKALSNS